VKTSELELDKATVVEKFGEFDVSQEEPETIENLDAEMSALEGTFEGCTSGVGGAKFKTPAGDLAQTVIYLQYLRQDAHGRQAVGAGRGANKSQLTKMPSTKFQSSDDHIFHMERDIAKQHVIIKFEEVVPQPKTTVATIRPQNAQVVAVPAWTSPTSSLAESDGGDVHDGGGDGAVHDFGPGSNLQEMPRPVLREECSKEEFQSFTQQWSLYARYHSGMDVGELRQQLLNSADGPLEAAMYDALGSKVDTLSQTDLLDKLEKLAVVQVIAVVNDVNYSTLINKSSEEKPSKPAPSDVTRRAKRARQRSAKYETAAVVEVENGDKLRDNRRKKQHNRIDLGGTSAHEFENSAMVELGRDKETQVASEFMTAHKKQEWKVIINKGTTETSTQKSKLNIRTDDNYNLSESDSFVKNEVPNVDEGLLTEVDEAKVHHELYEVSRLKLKVSEEPGLKEEEAQSVQPMQQALATEDTSVDAEGIDPQDTVQDQDQAPVPGHQTAQDQAQTQDFGCQRAHNSHSNHVPATTHSNPVPDPSHPSHGNPVPAPSNGHPVPALHNSRPVPDHAHSQPVPEDEAQEQVLATEAQQVNPTQQEMVAEDLAAQEVQHVNPTKQDLVAEDSVLATQAQRVPPIQQVLVAEDSVLATQAQQDQPTQQDLVAEA
jgi:hypothetical protein